MDEKEIERRRNKFLEKAEEGVKDPLVYNKNFKLIVSVMAFSVIVMIAWTIEFIKDGAAVKNAYILWMVIVFAILMVATVFLIKMLYLRKEAVKCVELIKTYQIDLDDDYQFIKEHEYEMYANMYNVKGGTRALRQYEESLIYSKARPNVEDLNLS